MSGRLTPKTSSGSIDRKMSSGNVVGKISDVVYLIQRKSAREICKWQTEHMWWVDRRAKLNTSRPDPGTFKFRQLRKIEFLISCKTVFAENYSGCRPIPGMTIETNKRWNPLNKTWKRWDPRKQKHSETFCWYFWPPPQRPLPLAWPSPTATFAPLTWRSVLLLITVLYFLWRPHPPQHSTSTRGMRVWIQKVFFGGLKAGEKGSKATHLDAPTI